MTTPATKQQRRRRSSLLSVPSRIWHLPWKDLCGTQRLICGSLPIWVLVLVSSLDSADKQLLASSFPILEKNLNLTVQTLGTFSLFSNLSYALSLPMWGFLVHKYGILKIHLLLSAACLCWGITTCGMALLGSSIIAQAILRSINGICLGSILPLSQTLLVDMVHSSMRGRAFGMLGLCEKLAGTLAAASVVYCQEDWKRPYYALGICSMAMGWCSLRELHPSKRFLVKPKTDGNYENDNDDDKNDNSNDATDSGNTNNSPQLTLREIIHRIVKLPAFLCLVAQGVFGGTPWDIMSFLLLLMDWRGFTKEQIVTIQFASGVSQTIGGWLGGLLGDAAFSAHGTKARIYVALISVVGGIPLYSLYVYSTDYRWALLWSTLFGLVATWPPPAACRPLCADLTRNPSERAQIISLWIVLEKASGAVFGAPLVGYLAGQMMTETELNTRGVSDEKARVLAYYVCLLSGAFWSVCALFWVAMAFTLPKSGKRLELGVGNDETKALV